MQLRIFPSPPLQWSCVFQPIQWRQNVLFGSLYPAEQTQISGAPAL